MIIFLLKINSKGRGREELETTRSGGRLRIQFMAIPARPAKSNFGKDIFLQIASFIYFIFMKKNFKKIHKLKNHFWVFSEDFFGDNFFGFLDDILQQLIAFLFIEMNAHNIEIIMWVCERSQFDYCQRLWWKKKNLKLIFLKFYQRSHHHYFFGGNWIRFKYIKKSQWDTQAYENVLVHFNNIIKIEIK